MVLLTDNSLVVVKYDFIRSCVIEGKRIPLVTINKLQIGDLVYPPRSLMSYVYWVLHNIYSIGVYGNIK